MYWMLIIFLFVMMGFQIFMAYRQNKQQQAKIKNFQTSIKPGDEVVLVDGIYGTIDSLSETTAKVRVSANSVIKVERYNIMRYADPEAEKAKAEAKAAEAKKEEAKEEEAEEEEAKEEPKGEDKN